MNTGIITLYVEDKHAQAGFVWLGGVGIFDRHQQVIAGSPLQGVRVADGDRVHLRFKIVNASDGEQARARRGVQAATTEELPMQTFERVTGMPWPGGKHSLVTAMLEMAGIKAEAGSADANLALQARLLELQGL